MSMTQPAFRNDNFSSGISNNSNHKNYNNNINNNIIIIRNTQPGVSSADGERIVAAYTECMGTGINAAVARMLESFLQTHTVEQLLDAIERTAFAPRPSPAYLRAVLRNYDTSRPCPVSKPWWQQNPALNYTQREYRDDDFDDSVFLKECERLGIQKPTP